MNFKLKTVLYFSKFIKPLDHGKNININTMRKKAQQASALGAFLFDSKIGIQKVENKTVSDVPVRIYNNNINIQNQRVIVYFHGGGFVLYDLDSHDNVCRRLCAMNECLVVSVDYRLAPEFSFPAAHDDAFKAITWVHNNIDVFGGNPSDIVLAGDSAGGNLAACMAHRCKKELLPVKAQILIYPWIDGKLNNPSIDRNGEGYLLNKETMFWFRKQYTPKEEDRCHPDVSPKYQTNFEGLPPAFVLTAQFDPLLDDGFNYAAQLQENGVKVQYKEYPTLIHGFFNMPKVSPIAMQAYSDVADFLKTI